MGGKRQIFFQNIETKKIHSFESTAEACRAIGKSYNNYLHIHGYIDDPEKRITIDKFNEKLSKGKYLVFSKNPN